MKKLFLFFAIVLMIAFIGYHFWLRYEAVIIYRELDPATSPKRQMPNPKEGQEVIRILAITGGGINGVIPNHILVYLEKFSGKPITELFDVMMGTSTGALATVSLTLPDQNGKPRYTAQQVLDFYHEDAKSVFDAPWYHRILTCNGIFGPKYLTAARYAVLKQRVGSVDFDQLLNNVVIPAYELYRKNPILFYNWKTPDTINQNFAVASLLLGAIAPPSIFQPVIFDAGKVPYALADGALFANNPALGALFTAMTLYPNRRYILVSLGTGEIEPAINPPTTVNWGLAQWGPLIIPIMLDSTGKFTGMSLENFSSLWPEIEYHHFDLPIANARGPGDDVSSKHLQDLDAVSESMIQEQRDKLDALVQKLL